MQMIFSILTNILSNQLYDGKAPLLKRLRFFLFRRNLKKWTQEYINKHDGTILTTDDFAAFINNHHLIEDIIRQVSDGLTCTSKEEFIKKEIAAFHRMQSPTQSIRRNRTNYELRDFIEHFYDSIDTYFRKALSQEEKYIISRIVSGEKALTETLLHSDEKTREDIADIKKLLLKKNELDDPERIWNIYQSLAKIIKDGRINEVFPIYPLLEGKSKDLENSVAYLLWLFSENSSFYRDFNQIQSDIVDDRIYKDVCRISVYVNSWRNKREELEKVSNRDQGLYDITKSVLSGNTKDLYLDEKKEDNGITFIHRQIQNHNVEEQWIIRRICIVDYFVQEIVNAAAIFREIVGEPNNILDRIILLQQKLREEGRREESQKNHIEELLGEAKSLRERSSELSYDFRVAIFASIIQIALLADDENIEEIENSVPEELHNNKQIELLLLEARSICGKIAADDVIITCKKYNEYWPFSNLIDRMISQNPIEAKAVLEKYLFVIDEDPSLFLVYIQLIDKLENTESAISLLETKEALYGGYVEFWIEKLIIQYNSDEMIALISSIKSGKLIYFSKSGPKMLVKLLVQNNKNVEAIDVIRTIESISILDIDIQKLKAIALMRTGREIEALSILTSIFDSGEQSEETVYYILALSLKNKRTVSENVLALAQNSNVPQMLTLAASYCLSHKDLSEAYSLNLKAMLHTTDDDNSEAFAQRLSLENARNHSETCKTTGVDVNTVVYLKSNDENSVAYAIHSESVLPEEPFLWEGICHIYTETAIKMGLLRKVLGQRITISNKEYIIESIEPLDAFLFQVSIQKCVSAGNAKKLVIPMTPEGRADKAQFIRGFQNAAGDTAERTAWLDWYNDFSKIPPAFSFCQRFVSCTFFDLVSTIVESNEIYYREEATDAICTDKGYVLSYAALIVLFKMGWNPSEKDARFAVSGCLKRIVNDEKETTIRNNNQDNVSFLHVTDDDCFVVKSSEDDKMQNMRIAVAFEEFCERFAEIENSRDLSLPESISINKIKDFLGIVDYDSIVISKSDKRVLVSAEVPVTAFASMPEVAVDCVCIVDFLSEVAKTPDELLHYIRKLVEYRFVIPFTYKTLRRLIQYYNESNEVIQKTISAEWDAILSIPLTDEAYKKHILLIMRDCVQRFENDSEGLCPVSRVLFAYALKYSKMKVSFVISEDGNIVPRIVPDDK